MRELAKETYMYMYVHSYSHKNQLGVVWYSMSEHGWYLLQVYVCSSGGSRQVSIVSVETPFWQTCIMSSLLSGCDFCKCNPLSGYRPKKNCCYGSPQHVLAESCLKADRWGWQFRSKTIEMGVASKIRAPFARNCITETPFKESWIRHCVVSVLT